MYSSTLSVTSALNGGGWSTPCPGRFTSQVRDPILGCWWAPGDGLHGCGKSRPPTGIRSPDRPARSGTMYNTKSQVIYFMERCDFLG